MGAAVRCVLSSPGPRILKCAFFPESGGSSDHDEDDDEDEGDYLHPSLFASKKCDRLEELVKVCASFLSGCVCTHRA